MIRTFKTHEVRTQEELTGVYGNLSHARGIMQEQSFRWQHRDALKQIHFLQITVEKPIFVKKNYCWWKYPY